MPPHPTVWLLSGNRSHAKKPLHEAKLELGAGRRTPDTTMCVSGECVQDGRRACREQRPFVQGAQCELPRLLVLRTRRGAHAGPWRGPDQWTERRLPNNVVGSSEFSQTRRPTLLPYDFEFVRTIHNTRTHTFTSAKRISGHRCRLSTNFTGFEDELELVMNVLCTRRGCVWTERVGRVFPMFGCCERNRLVFGRNVL